MRDAVDSSIYIKTMSARATEDIGLFDIANILSSLENMPPPRATGCQAEDMHLERYLLEALKQHCPNMGLLKQRLHTIARPPSHNTSKELFGHESSNVVCLIELPNTRRVRNTRLNGGSAIEQIHAHLSCCSKLKCSLLPCIVSCSKPFHRPKASSRRACKRYYADTQPSDIACRFSDGHSTEFQLRRHLVLQKGQRRYAAPMQRRRRELRKTFLVQRSTQHALTVSV